MQIRQSLIVTLRFPIILVMIAVAGCATPERVPDLAPPIQVSEDVWRQVDSEIVAESLAASGAAKLFAHRQMEHWRKLVAQRAEADFIPWFSSYWTQQWLTAKIAWYRLNAGETTEPPVTRLAVYVQEQYHDRVLAPVAEEVDPALVIAQATKFYIQRLGGQLQLVARRNGVPPDQFKRRLKSIPTIVLAPPPSHNACLYQVLYADQVDTLPAYVALLRMVREAGVHADPGLTKTRISPVARRVSEKMLDRLAVSGGTSAASALVGGMAGAVISLGAAGIGVIMHEPGRREIEAELRDILNASMDDIWRIVMEERSTGVTAGIYYLSDQIEKSLVLQSFTQPVAPVNLPQ